MRLRLRQLVGGLHTGQYGVANIGAIFMLMAVLAGGSMFAYAATQQGALAALQFSSVTNDALGQTGHVVITPGPVYVQDANRDRIIDGQDAIALDANVALGGNDASLDSMLVMLTTPSGRFRVTPAISMIKGDDDATLELGEIAELRFAPPTMIEPGETIAIEVTPSDGPTTKLDVTMPPAIDGLMTLY